jgi:hypothetical protein
MVWAVTSPKSHNTTRITAIVQSIAVPFLSWCSVQSGDDPRGRPVLEVDDLRKYTGRDFRMNRLKG